MWEYVASLNALHKMLLGRILLSAIILAYINIEIYVLVCYS